MKVRMTFTEEVLGTASADPKIHEEFIAKKSADKEKIKEELASLPSDRLLEKEVTVFHRGVDNEPILFDYQVKGFIKEAIRKQVEFGHIELQKKPKTVVKLSKYTYKRIVDNFIFVFPRIIKLILPSEGEMGYCTRPLRGDTQKGERIALATSETVPVGTVIECEIRWLHEALKGCILEALKYGKMKGIGQWRNSGKGRFDWVQR